MRMSTVTRVFMCAALILSLAVLAPPGAADATLANSWRWQNPEPRGDSLSAVHWVPGTDVVWAVGNYGCILKSYDAGVSWIAKTSGTTADLAGADFSDSSHGWVVGATDTVTGTILKTTDGASWSPQTMPVGASGLTDIDVIDASHAWAVGYNGTIVKTADGATWAVVSSPSVQSFSSVCFLTANMGWVAGSGGIFYTDDGGASWDDISIAGFTAEDIVFTDATHGWAVGNDGANHRVFFTENNLNWGYHPMGGIAVTGATAQGVSFADANHGWIITSSGQIWVTANASLGASSTWAQQTDPYDSPYLQAVDFGSTLKGIVVGAGGVMARTGDGGATWAKRVSASSEMLSSVDFPTEKIGYATAGPDVIKTTDAGENWVLKDTGANTWALRAIDFVDEQTGWAVGQFGAILKTTDGGLNWTAQTSTAATELQSVSFVDASYGWICSYDGSIQNTTDGGANWHEQVAAGSDTRQAIDFFDRTHGICVGGNGSVLWTADGGTTWNPGTSGTTVPIKDVDMVSATKAFMVGYNLGGAGQPLLKKTANGGNTWSTAGTSPVPWIDLEAVTFSSELNGWVAGGQGTLLHTTDGGTNWTNERITTEYVVDLSSVPGTNSAWATGFNGMVLTNYVVPTPPAPVKTVVYRFYNLKNGTHFYTASYEEKLHIIATWPDIYKYEGIGYEYDGSKATQPLYRFYNVKSGSHFYTASLDEANNVILKWGDIYAFEGVAYNVSATPVSGGTVYRFYNIKSGSHFYTASPQERDMVIATWPDVFHYEGEAFYLPM